MKKFFVLILVMTLFFMFGCSNGNQVKKKDSPEASEQETESADQAESETESISTEKGIFNVTITLPASLFEGQDINATVEDMKKNNKIKDIVINDDGSITAKMSKSDHKKMMDEMRASIIESFEEMKTSGDFASVKDVKYNNDFTDITIEVDQDAFENSFDGFAVLGVGIPAMMYQAFNAVPEDEIKVTINIKNYETGEIFNTIIYPDDLGDM